MDEPTFNRLPCNRWEILHNIEANETRKMFGLALVTKRSLLTSPALEARSFPTHHAWDAQKLMFGQTELALIYREMCAHRSVDAACVP